MTNETPEIKIIGPFATEYSLARVNRELAFALDEVTDKYKISLYLDKDNIDKIPSAKEFKRYPKLKKLLKDQDSKSRIAIFNNFPKSFPHSFGLDKINAEYKLAYLAWEETGFPESIILEMNESLHGVMATSEHVVEVLRAAGLKIPVVNVGEGLERKDIKIENYKLKTKKSFKFLHVSSGIPRKGVDVLLKAYFDEFNSSDDVVLVIKTYHNESNKIPDLLDELTKENSPEVEVIYDLELTDGQMASLYSQADAVVLPSRAEGFGLPQGEAMMYGVPLITTAYSGHTDFVNEKNSWLLDYEIVQAESQLALMNSFWAEPDKDQLMKFMRELYENKGKDMVHKKVSLAKEAVSDFTWHKTSKAVLDFIEKVESFGKLKNTRLVVVGTINSRCGIAEYSTDLYKPISRSFGEVKFFSDSDANILEPDNSQIERTWEQGEHDFSKTLEAIGEYSPEIVHIQYNSPFYGLDALASLVEGLHKQNRQIYLTIHSLPKANFFEYRASLSKVNKIYVHSKKHFDVLEKDSFENVYLFEHGFPRYLDENKKSIRKKYGLKNSPIIASHGLIHDKKGLVETIEALPLLVEKYPDILFLSINALNVDNLSSAYVSEQMDKKIHELALENNVIRITDFISKDEIIKLLHLADLVVLPYGELDEGASGAVRYSLTSCRPVIRTNSSIFKDLGEIGYLIENNNPKTIANAVLTLLGDGMLYDIEVEKNKKFITEHTWDKQGLRYLQDISENL